MINNKYLDTREPLYGEAVKMANGDYSSYESFYSLSVEYLFKLVADIVGDEDATNKIITDVYYDIYANISSLGDIKSFYVWAGNIATDKAFKYVCETGRADMAVSQPNAFSEYVAEWVIQDEERFIPEDFMRQESIKAVMKSRFDAMPAIPKCIMQKYYYHDMSVTQIARELNMTPNAVRNELSTIKRFMKDVIVSGYGPDYENRIRVNSLAEVSVVWLLFSEAVRKMAVVGTVAGAAVAGGAAVVNSAAGAVGGAAVVNSAAGAVGGAATVNSAAGAVGGAAVGNVAVASAGTGTGISGGAGAVVGSGMASGGVSGGTGAAVAGTAKVGMGIGAKIGIGIAGAAAVVGGGAAIYVATQDKETESEPEAVEDFREDLIFTEQTEGYQSPAYVNFVDYDYNEIQIDGVDIIQNDSTTRFLNVDEYLQEGLEEGQRRILVETETTLPVEVFDPEGNIGNIYASVGAFGLFDLNTGTILPMKDTVGDDVVGGELSVDDESGSYEISYTLSSDWVWGDWVFSGDGHNEREVTVTWHYEIVLSEDYDDLCLWYDCGGVDHMLDNMSYDTPENISDMENLENILCYRLYDEEGNLKEY
ncbi:MAG: sigma-70 family RNA polymerase sigma factor [Lachnospiraceae bacterium]|nr:sigma-70 family RNA polymerase sigma factor [Lachnospiraceae bacterium]